mmetsp:Transcript_3912/g.9283  ORF Transcript_3912/g.9283 Transcript_3912/m.9283 type:complete len:231 (+) Transcript_3912:490-1182(+)
MSTRPAWPRAAQATRVVTSLSSASTRATLCSTSSARTRTLSLPSSMSLRISAMAWTRRGCWTTDAMSWGRHPSFFPTLSKMDLATDPSLRSASSRRYGWASLATSYLGSRPFPIPSKVVKARKTKVKAAGKTNGRSSPTVKSSDPILVRRAFRMASCSSGESSFSHTASSSLSVFWNSSRKARATISIEVRSTSCRRIPICCAPSTTALASFSYTPKVRRTKPFRTYSGM